jgi:hypothetical protein
VFINNSGSVTIGNAGTNVGTNTQIDGVTGDGIDSTNTTLTVRDFTIGGNTAIPGVGIRVDNSDGTARVVTLNNLNITSVGNGIVTTDGGNAGELSLTLNGNTIETTGALSLAMSITGSGLNSTTVNQFNGVTVTPNGVGGGIIFNRVTFDAATGGAVTQVAGGTANIGANFAAPAAGDRVQGDGLSFLNPTGDIIFTAINIANNVGTGLEVDTKGLGTTFNLVNGGGTINTLGGPALFLDPLTGDLTFTAVTSMNSTMMVGTAANASGNGTGIFIDGLIGNGAGANALTIGAITIDSAAGNGIEISNSAGTFTFNGLANVISNLASTANAIEIMQAGGTSVFRNFTIGPVSANQFGIIFSTLNGAASGLELGGNVVDLNGTAGTGYRVFADGAGNDIMFINSGGAGNDNTTINDGAGTPFDPMELNGGLINGTVRINGVDLMP